jgi:hypothetical protein
MVATERTLKLFYYYYLRAGLTDGLNEKHRFNKCGYC